MCLVTTKDSQEFDKPILCLVAKVIKNEEIKSIFFHYRWNLNEIYNAQMSNDGITSDIKRVGKRRCVYGGYFHSVAYSPITLRKMKLFKEMATASDGEHIRLYVGVIPAHTETFIGKTYQTHYSINGSKSYASKQLVLLQEIDKFVPYKKLIENFNKMRKEILNKKLNELLDGENI